MKITLKRTVEVLYYSVQMTIFEKENRPEIIPLLKAVYEANQTNSNIINYMQEILFPNLPIRFVENIIEELRLMGLIKEGALTPRGRETLEKEEVMVPRTGPYQLEVVDDPLISQVIIGYNPLKPNLKEELELREDQIDKLVELPDFLEETLDTRVNILEERFRTIDIKEIQERGSLNRKRSRLELSLISSGEFWELKVRYKGFTGFIDIPGQFDETELIDELFQEISTNSDLDRWRIPQNPDSLSLTELSQFKKNFRIHSFFLEGLGEFNQITLEDVAIIPDSIESAEDWAKRLFLEQLSSYMFKDRYLNSWDNLIDKYPVLAEYDITPPPLGELWLQIPFGSRKYWFLRAPSDMRLEEVVEE